LLINDPIEKFGPASWITLCHTKPVKFLCTCSLKSLRVDPHEFMYVMKYFLGSTNPVMSISVYPNRVRISHKSS